MSNFKPTQGSKKINNYFSALIKSDSFNNFVADSKKKYNIPKLGFDNNGKYLSPPKEWEVDTGKNSKYDNLINEIENFCRGKKLLYFNSYTDIYDFIVYNEPLKSIDDDLCMLCYDTMARTKMARASYRADNKPLEEGKVEVPDIEEEENIIYPLSIMISPYASIRDIIDFVKKNSKDVIKWQNNYKDKDIKIGKLKNKKPEIQERNELIYNNKNKPLKEIRHILADKNIFLDDGHIAKVISLEKQKRKEV